MVFGALAIVLLAACSNDENETMIDNTGNRASFYRMAGTDPCFRPDVE